jgi:tetratricopeptide (TPR) repeat protein
MSYKTSTKSAATVARELGVDAVLEGAVRGSRDRLRITTQVVNAADDSTLWSKSYEASSADLLAVQENIARSVAAVVFPGDPPQASAHVRSRGTTPAAYTEILQGHALRRVGDFGADAQRALEHYRKAVALDPKSALAHASLALGLERLAGSTGIDEARAAAERALALDPELSESHAAMAWVHYRNHDWEEGHRESRRAMALNPSSFDACTCFAIIMAWTGRDTEALAVADEVIARNPRGAAAYANRAMVLYFGRRYGGALASARQALALDPAIFLPKVVGPMALGWLGRADEGVAQLASSGPQKTHVMAMLLGRAGRHGEARQLMQEVASATPPVDSVFMAFGYGWLGDKERTISWLTRSVESRESRAAQVIDETFDFVRADPRFEALVRKMKMPSSYYEFLRSKGAPASSSLP